LKEQVIDSIQNWLITTIIKKATIKLATMFNPVGAIIQAILMIYDTVMFFIENINRILDFVEAVVTSFYKIATGAIGEAANWIEKALANTIPIIIAFLARLLGISGITDRIVSTIKKLQSRVDRAVDKVIEKVVGGIKKLVGAGKAAVSAVFQWWKKKTSFKMGKETHALSFKGEAQSAQLVLESSPTLLSTYLSNLTPKPSKKKLDEINDQIKIIEEIKTRTKGGFGQGDGEKIQAAFEKIVVSLKTLTGEPPATKADWSTKQNLPSGKVTREFKADPLSINPGGNAGSEPHDESPLWKKVNQRPMTYIRGHLLNHNLHGPGEDKNLIPITRSANSTMSSGPETAVKKAILIENKVVKYTVVAVFGKHPVRKVIPEEAEMPTGIKIEAVELDKGDSNKWDKPGKIIYKDTVPNTLPPDLPVGHVFEEVNLSKPDLDHLNKSPYIKSVRGLAVRIKNERERRPTDFHSWDQLPLKTGEEIEIRKESKWVKLHE
jgi:hypothetical protein